MEGMAAASSLFYLPAGSGFADTLASHLLQQYPHPERLLILLPNRRSILSMRQAFLANSEGKALLLPRMVALGDLDEKAILRYGKPDEATLAALQALPPAIDTMKRHLDLAQLVSAYYEARHHPMRMDQTYQLAVDLASLLDELQRERCDLSKIDTLAPAEFAEEWQQTLDFLKIIRDYWPEMLASGGVTDPWLRRNRLLEILAECWRKQYPDYPVIIAGTTGSTPAVADVIKVVATLPDGAIYLPACDMDMNQEAWNGMDSTHPQYGLKVLLDKLGMPREKILPLIPASKTHTERLRWLSQSFLPAEFSDTWRISSGFSAQPAVSGCFYLTVPSLRQEAQMIALLMREALEYTDKTVALVTPDKTLARQVRAQMVRWGIMPDDSAGVPLHHLPAGNFLLLLLEAIQENFSAVTTLNLLKHPLCRLGKTPGEIRGIIHKIEKAAMRGIQPIGLLSLSERVRSDNAATAMLKHLVEAVAPLQLLIAEEESGGVDAHPLPQLLTALLEVSSYLTRDADGAILLWRGQEGTTLRDLLESLIAYGSTLTCDLYEGRLFLRSILAQTTVRENWQQHPRIHILSPMEARMIRADRIILSGLNEGSWPAHTEAEPWLNRAMRNALGLPPPEYQIGLLAHDFYSLVAMPEVFITRSRKDGGAMTLPSRFIQRMQAVLEIAAAEDTIPLTTWQQHPVLEWSAALDTPENTLPPLAAPAPCPPAEVRPYTYSATALEILLRDPYAFYAKNILKLELLKPLGLLPGVAEFGMAVHAALDEFARHAGWQQSNPYDYLLTKGMEAFQPYAQFSPIIHALWWPRFERIAQWILLQPVPEKGCLTEQKARWEIPGTDGKILILTARIDRIDIADSGYKIIDYKTGSPPTLRQIALGLGIQLTLAATMVEEGCLSDDLQHKPYEALHYWSLHGGMKGGTIRDIPLAEAPALIDDIKTKLVPLLQEYQSGKRSYPAMPDRRIALRYNDYYHLARIGEWGR